MANTKNEGMDQRTTCLIADVLNEKEKNIAMPMNLTIRKPLYIQKLDGPNSHQVVLWSFHPHKIANSSTNSVRSSNIDKTL